MTIIDRARDALDGTDNLFGAEEQCSAKCRLAAELVRRHDELTALADELKAQGERLGKSTYVHERAEGAGYAATAARIRAVIERERGMSV